MEKPEPKTLVTPSGKVQTSNLSIKKMMAPPKEGDEAATSINYDNMPRESFSTDDMKMHWRRVAHQMKSLGKETVYNALIKRDPIVTNDTEFVLEVDNDVQVALIKVVIDDIITYLRSSLKNYDISLELKVITVETGIDVRNLNGNDRYKYLLTKYPYLAKLKEVFGLDVEY